MRNAHVPGEILAYALSPAHSSTNEIKASCQIVAFSDSDSLVQRLHIARFLRDRRHVLESFGNEKRSVSSGDASRAMTESR
jgi:hypothetical protein